VQIPLESKKSQYSTTHQRVILVDSKSANLVLPLPRLEIEPRNNGENIAIGGLGGLANAQQLSRNMGKQPSTIAAIAS